MSLDRVTFAELACSAVRKVLDGGRSDGTRIARLVMTLRDDARLELLADAPIAARAAPGWTVEGARATLAWDTDQLSTLPDEPETLFALRRLAAERPDVRIVLRLPSRAARR